MNPFGRKLLKGYFSDKAVIRDTAIVPRNYSGVSYDSFVRKVTFQKLSAKGIQNIGPAIELMAEAEELFAHKNAVTLRLNSLKNV